MALETVQTKLITCNVAEIDAILKELFSKNVAFEIMDPYEFEGEWLQAIKLQDPLQSEIHPKVELVGEVLTQTSPKGLFSGLIDHRYTASLSEIESIHDEQETLLHEAELIHSYYYLTKLYKDITAAKPKKAHKVMYYGTNLQEFVFEFEKYLEYLNSITEEFEVSTPQIDVQKVDENWDSVTFSNDYESEIQEYILKHGNPWKLQKVSLFKKEISEKVTHILSLLETKNIKPGKVSSEKRRKLSILHASLIIDEKIHDFKEHIFKTQSDSDTCFAFISVSKSSYKDFVEVLNAHTVKAQEYQAERSVVVWENKTGLGAFQNIIKALGTIGSRESDPTPVVAIFFSLFFALALNDAIYGLIITLFSAYFLFFTKLKEGVKGFMQLFFFSGLMTIVVGAATGSWLGDFIPNFMSSLVPTFETVQLINLIDPNASVAVNSFLVDANTGLSPIVAMLGFAILVGILHILFAYVYTIINALKQRDPINAVSEVSWVVFLFSSVAYLITNSQIILYLAIAGVIGFFVFNSGKGIVGRFVGGLVKLYGLISLFADMISYTRLVAIGLTGSIIANVINLLSLLLRDAPQDIPVVGPMLGIVLWVGFLILGHGFNMIIGLFGAYINPLRLHYVEFLPKFFTGGGREFKPLTLSFPYLKIQ